MKKIYTTLLVLILLLPIKSFAQKTYAVDKGSTMISGGVYFSQSGGDIFDGGELLLVSLKFNSYFFSISNLGIGPILIYENSNFDPKSSKEDASSSNSTGFGPSIAYYFGDKNTTTFPYISSSVIFGRKTGNWTTIDYRFSGGLAVMIHKNVAVTVESFYMIKHYTYKHKYGTKGSKITRKGYEAGFEIGISAFIF